MSKGGFKTKKGETICTNCGDRNATLGCCNVDDICCYCKGCGRYE